MEAAAVSRYSSGVAHTLEREQEVENQSPLCILKLLAKNDVLVAGSL